MITVFQKGYYDIVCCTHLGKMKQLLIMLFSIMLYGRNNAQQQSLTALDNEEWTLTQSGKGQGIGSGSIWQFFSNYTFNATHWYSGGAYWTHQYTGTYYYDAVTATVFLKYKKNTRLPPVRKNLCIQVIDAPTDSIGYYPVFYNGWAKQQGKHVPLGEPQILKQQLHAPADTLKIFNFPDYITSFRKRKIPISKSEL